MNLAVGFSPRIACETKSRRVATFEIIPAIESSLRDESILPGRVPWVETHG